MMQSAKKDTNWNSLPRCRSISPPKINPAMSPIELVKYPHRAPTTSLATQNLSDCQKEALSSSPRVSSFPLPSSHSSRMDNDENSSVQLEKQVLFQKHNSDSSTLHNTKSSLGRRAKSATSKQLKCIKQESYTPVEDFHVSLSVPSNMMKAPHITIEKKVHFSIMKAPHITIENKTTPSALSSEKKVIFNLRKNRANKFQDYLKSVTKQPVLPFQPSKSPVDGILKSPVTLPLQSSSSSDSDYLPSLPASKKAAESGRQTSARGSSIQCASGSTKKKGSLKNTRYSQNSQSPSSST